MRILLVTDWVRRRGGTETYFAALRAGLRAAGNDARLLTSTAGGAADGSADYRAFGTERIAAQALLQIANPSAFLRVRSAVREFRPDVAFVGMYEQHLSPAIFRALNGVPTVLALFDYRSICPIGTKLLHSGDLCTVDAGSVCWRGGCVSLPHWLRDRPRYALIRSAIAKADRVVACSESLRGALAAGGIRADVLLPAISGPSARFRRVPAGRPEFVFVGRLSREKGVPVLLRAFARLRGGEPSARLRLIGEGDERQAVERIVAELGLGESVSLVGWLPPEEIERELASTWALVAPSIWAEPFGLVAAEAIVRGVPVVASATGGFAETVEHGTTGLLFPNGDEAALAHCLAELAAGRAFPSRSIAPGVVAAAAERYSLAEHVGRVEEICATVVSPVARGEYG